jgi:diguanylate cyclase (GGDEF)-like protein
MPVWQIKKAEMHMSAKHKESADEAEKNFGIVKRRSLRNIQSAFLIVMAVFIVIFIINVNSIQGNARVINYAGMVRGGTQKLVKEELYGLQDDRMIAQMDSLLYSLSTGQGEYGNIRLDDRTYQDSLAGQMKDWDALKAEILAYRADSSEKQQLFQMSQDYFRTADQTVTLAQNYSGTIENRIEIIEWFLIAIIGADALIVILYGIELRKASKHNMKFNAIAYLDPCTGLSNKRKCEERLSDKEPIPASEAVTCFMFDINDLKKMNDEHGHEAGDELIAGFGEALRQEALPHMFIGRFGGDEFMAVAVGISREEADAFNARLHDNCMHRSIAGVEHISFASGFAVSSEFSGISISSLMKTADQRMYENKKSMKSGRTENQ